MASFETIFHRVVSLATGLARKVVFPAEVTCALGLIPACAIADIAAGMLVLDAGVTLLREPSSGNFIKVTVGVVNLATGRFVEARVLRSVPGQSGGALGKEVGGAVSVALERAEALLGIG